MTVVMTGTGVPFAEVEREAWARSGTVPFVRAPRYQCNITTRSGKGGLALSRTGTAVLAVPPPAISRGPRNRMAATESGKVLAQRITDLETAEPVTLHVADLGAGQQGIGHESVIAEHRVVVAGHVCFGRPHSLLPSMIAPPAPWRLRKPHP